MIIGYKDFLYKENADDDTIEMSIQFSMHIDQEEWYVASWLQKRDYAIVRIYSDSRAKRLDWYRYRLTNHIKDDEIIEEQHFHVYSDIRPDLQLLKRVCEMFAREKYIIQKGIVPDITYEKKWWLLGTFEVAERKVVMWVGTQTNPNTLIIKALNRTDLNGNKFTNMAILGDDGSLDIDPNEFKIHALVGGSDGGIFVNGLNSFNPMICVGGNNGGLFPGGNWSFVIDNKIMIYKEIKGNKFDNGIPLGYSDNSASNTSAKIIYNLYENTFSKGSDFGMESSIENISDMDPDNQKFYACDYNMNYAFSGCIHLKEIPYIYNFNIVTSTRRMFSWTWEYYVPGGRGYSEVAPCESITTIPLLDTSNVTDMSSMFCCCYSLKTIPQLDTGNVSSMYEMFSSCKSLESIPLLNTSKVSDMYEMFGGCESLKEIPQLDTSNVVRMQYMFSRCISMKTIPKLNTDKVVDMRGIFNGCKKEFIHNALKNFSSTDNVTDISLMFGSSDIEKMDMLEFNKNGIKNIKYCNQLFNNCTKLTNIDNLILSNNTVNISSMFSGTSLATLNLSNWDTSSVVDMNHLFYKCTSLTSLDISNWDTSSVVDMSFMFAGCTSLTSLDISNWDTSNVVNMKCMFGDLYINNAASITTLNLSNWDTSKVTDISFMFNECKSLTKLNVSTWNTANIKNMRYTFFGCNYLASLDISNWDTSNVTTMEEMFEGCASLKTIIGEIDMTSCTNYKYMFVSCTNLTGVKLKNVPSNFDPSEAGLSAGQYTIVS